MSLLYGRMPEWRPVRLKTTPPELQHYELGFSCNISKSSIIGGEHTDEAQEISNATHGLLSYLANATTWNKPHLMAFISVTTQQRLSHPAPLWCPTIVGLSRQEGLNRLTPQVPLGALSWYSMI